MSREKTSWIDRGSRLVRIGASHLAIALLLLGVATPALAQRTITVNLGDLFKRKADTPQATAQPASAKQEAGASASDFNLWVAGRPHPLFGKCYRDGSCFSSTITRISPGQGEEVATGEVLVRVDSNVQTDDNGRITHKPYDTTVRCSKRRPLIEGYEVEFFANGQPTSSGTLAEEYLLVCHSFQGEAADGARRYGYPLVP